MRLFLIALLFAISYAQTERYANRTVTQASQVNSDIYVGCQQVEYQSTCDKADLLKVTLVDTLYDELQCSETECSGAGWTEKNNDVMRTLGPIGCQVIVSHHGSDDFCQAGSEIIVTTSTAPGFPTPTPTMSRNFALGSEDEGVDAYWIIACMLMVMFCCQMIFFGWCCYTDAQNKRAKPDTYNMPIEMAPQRAAPVMVTAPAEGNGVEPVNITLESVPSNSVGGMDIVKSISPSVSTYQVADGTLPGSFYNEETAPSPTAPEANLGDSLRAKPSSPQTGGASVGTPKKGGMAEEIRKLKALVDEGVISEEEYQSGKAKLLGTSSQHSDI